MKKFLVRFVSLYVFNVVVLFVMGIILPGVQVGFHAFWAGIILTIGVLWIKPVLARLFGRVASNSDVRARVSERLVRYLIVFVVELLLWIVTVWLSGVSTDGLFFAYIVAPLLLLVAWIIYDAIDDVIEARASSIYDTASRKLNDNK